MWERIIEAGAGISWQIEDNVKESSEVICGDYNDGGDRLNQAMRIISRVDMWWICREVACAYA